jgi:hypothetical protein
VACALVCPGGACGRMGFVRRRMGCAHVCPGGGARGCWRGPVGGGHVGCVVFAQVGGEFVGSCGGGAACVCACLHRWGGAWSWRGPGWRGLVGGLLVGAACEPVFFARVGAWRWGPRGLRTCLHRWGTRPRGFRGAPRAGAGMETWACGARTGTTRPRTLPPDPTRTHAKHTTLPPLNRLRPPPNRRQQPPTAANRRSGSSRTATCRCCSTSGATCTDGRCGRGRLCERSSSCGRRAPAGEGEGQSGCGGSRPAAARRRRRRRARRRRRGGGGAAGGGRAPLGCAPLRGCGPRLSRRPPAYYARLGLCPAAPSP